ADRVDRGAKKLTALLVGERGSLARRPRDDETVGAVLDEMLCECPERVVVDRPVVPEGSDDRGQDLAEHGLRVYRRGGRLPPIATVLQRTTPRGVAAPTVALATSKETGRSTHM